MSDKEERICICKLEGNATESVCGGSMTRQEAIEIMAKAIFEWQRPGCRGDVPIEDVWNNEQEGYEKLAEAAFNALLEGVKK